MDLARLRDEALRPAYEGQPVQYRAYSCREGAYLPARELAAAAGDFGGQLQPPPAADRLRNAAGVPDLRKEEQTRRLQAREGSDMPILPPGGCRWRRAIFAQYHIAETADFVADTTQSGTI